MNCTERKYYCRNCPKYKRGRCVCWEVKVTDPDDSYCEAVKYWIDQNKNNKE